MWYFGWESMVFHGDGAVWYQTNGDDPERRFVTDSCVIRGYGES